MVTNMYSIIEIRCFNSMVSTVPAQGSAMRGIRFYDNSRIYGGIQVACTTCYILYQLSTVVLCSL